MGMFDSVNVSCVCGANVEFQSKAGECSLENYRPDAVPVEIALSLDDTCEVCRSCGRYVTLHLNIKPVPSVPMWVEISEE